MKRIVTLLAVLSLSAQLRAEVNVLVFGHSFGQDCVTYVPSIAKSLGVDDLRVCLYLVGNCSIENHFNILNGAEGRYAGKMADPGKTEFRTLKMKSSEAICKYKWDYVVLQTSLENEGRYETVQPALNGMMEKISTAQQENFGSTPVFCWNLFWPISTLLENKPENKNAYYRLSFYEQSSLKAWEAYKATAARVLAETGVSRIIPSGQAVMDIRSSSLNTPDKKEFTRDGYHMSYGYGRFVAGCAFYQALLSDVYGKSVVKSSFVPEGKYPVKPKDAKKIRKSVAKSVASFGK